MTSSAMFLLCVCYVTLTLVRSTPVAFIRPASSQESAELEERGDDRDFVVFAPSRAERASLEWDNDDFRGNEVFRPIAFRTKKDNKVSAGQIVSLLNNLARERGLSNGKMKGIRFGVSK